MHRNHEEDEKLVHDGYDVINLTNMVFDLFKKYGVQELFYKDMINYKIHYICQEYTGLNEDYRQEFWQIIHDDYLKIKQDSVLHEEFMKNLDDNNKRFYLHVLQSRSAAELDYLENYDDEI